MKNSLLISLLFIAIIGQAQEVPNSGFEAWEEVDNYEFPTGWESSNEATYMFPIYELTAEKTEDAHSGNYAAKLTSVDIMGNVSPGFITTARFNFTVIPLSTEIVGGIYFPYRPHSLTGYYKYTPANETDYCVVGAALLNASLDTIGIAEFYGNDTIEEYTMFTAEFYYLTDDIPDSLSLSILSTNFENPVAGSIMFIDDLQINMPTGESIELMPEQKTIYPNPTHDNCYIEVKSKTLVKVYDITGRLHIEKTIEAGKHPIDLSQLNKGQYIIKLYENEQISQQVITKY